MKKMFIIILIIFTVLLSSCGKVQTTDNSGTTSAVTTPDAVSSATVSRYRENEIRDYKGEQLDPAVGPGDNSISGTQHVDIKNYNLLIDGLVTIPIKLNYTDVLEQQSVERLITLHCVTGWDATILWKGIQLSQLLNIAGVKPEANTVIFHCVDGYTTSLPLSTIIENKLIMAYNANGLQLPDSLGYPFIFVAENKLGYKWARWIVRIELSADASYSGYWESRGYDNTADVK